MIGKTVRKHEVPAGSTIVNDPQGEGYLVIGYRHAPYLVGFDGTLTDITTGAVLVDGPVLTPEDAATLPEP